MMLFAEQRRKLALFICPEIARAIRSDEHQMQELRKAAGYIGQSKPIAWANADAEASAFRQARQSWLLAEKAILAEHGDQLLSLSGGSSSIHVKKFEQDCANAVDDLGIISGSIKQDGIDHQLERIDARGSVLQRLNLFIRHVLLRLKDQQATPGLDSAQAEPEKDRA